MFGYVKTYTPDLRVRENEYYRAVYCGLCRAQGKCTGQCSRFTLSYDITFLSLVRMAASNTDVSFKRGRCIAHPIKKRAYAVRNPELEFCAYASALLVYGKCRDDISDERGTKKLKAKLARPFASHMRKKSVKKYADLDKTVTEGLKKLADTEQKKLPSVDIPADCFGEILANICAYGYEGSSDRYSTISEDISADGFILPMPLTIVSKIWKREDLIPLFACMAAERRPSRREPT